MHQHPLIKNWDEAKVIKRAHLQAIKKFGAEKVIWTALFLLVFNQVMDLKLTIFKMQVIIELEPNESKVRTSQDNSDQGIGDQYNERMRHDNFENDDWNENVMIFLVTLRWTVIALIFLVGHVLSVVFLK